MNNVANFIKEYFIFKVPEEHKNLIRTKVMETDHKGYSLVSLLIAAMQLTMLVVNLLNYGIKIDPEKTYALIYRCLYLFLFLVSISSFFLSEYFYRHKKMFSYFSIINFFMVATYFWAVGISIMDSAKNVAQGYITLNILVFGYVVMAVSCMIVLEPWLVLIDLLGATIVLNVVLATIPSTRDAYTSGTIINTVSICLLSFCAALINFTKRVRQYKLENEIKSLNAILKKQAHFDELTQLNNRRYLTEKIDDQLNLGDNATNVVIFDIDKFKKINDKYGHQNGDICLRELGKLINNFCENKECYPVRFGGEEFLIRIDGIQNDEVFKLVDEFRETVANHPITLLNKEVIHFTISLGIAVADGTINYSGLISRADIALYESKKTNNKTTLYNESMKMEA